MPTRVFSDVFISSATYFHSEYFSKTRTYVLYTILWNFFFCHNVILSVFTNKQQNLHTHMSLLVTLYKIHHDERKMHAREALHAHIHCKVFFIQHTLSSGVRFVLHFKSGHLSRVDHSAVLTGPIYS